MCVLVRVCAHVGKRSRVPRGPWSQRVLINPAAARIQRPQHTHHRPPGLPCAAVHGAQTRPAPARVPWTCCQEAWRAGGAAPRPASAAPAARQSAATGSPGGDLGHPAAQTCWRLCCNRCRRPTPSDCKARSTSCLRCTHTSRPAPASDQSKLKLTLLGCKQPLSAADSSSLPIQPVHAFLYMPADLSPRARASPRCMPPTFPPTAARLSRSAVFSRSSAWSVACTGGRQEVQAGRVRMSHELYGTRCYRKGGGDGGENLLYHLLRPPQPQTPQKLRTCSCTTFAVAGDLPSPGRARWAGGARPLPRLVAPTARDDRDTASLDCCAGAESMPPSSSSKSRSACVLGEAPPRARVCVWPAGGAAAV